MADLTTRTLVELSKLGEFKEYLMEKVATADSAVDAKSLKTVAIEGTTIKFYREMEPVADGTTPAFEIELPETDLSAINSAIEKLNGSENTEGSVKYIAKQYADEVQASLDAETERATNAENALAAKISTLVGAVDGDDAKSVRTISAEEVAKIVNGADESYDTLKEISDWISSHSSDAAAMNSSIVSNTSAISALQALVGVIPVDNGGSAVATDVIAYIQKLVSAEETRAKAAEGGLDTRLTAVEEAIGDGGSVDEMIASAINELDATVSQAAGDDGVSATVVEEDGKLKSVSVSIKAETYDKYGSADKVQGNLDTFIGSITYASSEQIKALFA